MRFTSRLAGIVLSIVFAAPSHAVTLSGNAVQVNAPPASGYYAMGAPLVRDIGGGNFLVGWLEDVVNDTLRQQGGRIIVRGFHSAGSTPTQFSPPVKLTEQTTSSGALTLLGMHLTPASDAHVLWSYAPTFSSFALYDQVLKNGVKFGAVKTLIATTPGSAVRYMGQRADDVGAFMWRDSSTLQKGRFMTAQGAMSTAFSIVPPPGQVLFRTEPVGNTYAITFGKTNASFTRWSIYGRTINAQGQLTAKAVTLLSNTVIDDNPFMNIIARADGTVVFLYGLINASNKLDLYGRAYSADWTALAARVKIMPNLPVDVMPRVAALPDGDLLVSMQVPEGTGQIVKYTRLGGNLLPTGTSAKIGPLGGIGDMGIATLDSGKVAAFYSINGRKTYVRMITP